MIHLIVGNTGAGKTCYAMELRKKNHGIIYSIDKWNRILFLPDRQETDGVDWFLERFDRAETLIMDMIDQLEESGVDCILDLGLAKYEHREKFRKFAREKGYHYQLHFIDIDANTRWERILQRNNEKAANYEFEVTRAQFDFMENWFEKPQASELTEAIIIKS